MNFSKKLVAICFFIFISCNNIQEPKNPAATDNFLQAGKIFDTTRFEPNTIDTFRYLKLPYWESGMDRYDSAYIDSFSVDSVYFRFINPVANKPRLDIYIYLEKQINDKWIFTGFGLGTGNHIGAYNHSKDINGDGFNDITQSVRFVHSVYFYDPKKKDYFVDSTSDENYINPDWTLIDTARKIFCDFQDFKQMCNQIHSTLYTYDGFVRHNLYDLELYNCTETNNDTHLVTKLILSKCVKRKKIDMNFSSEDSLIELKSVTLKKPIDLDKDYDINVGYFDYVKYWKERYKSLLGYGKGKETLSH